MTNNTGRGDGDGRRGYGGSQYGTMDSQKIKIFI